MRSLQCILLTPLFNMLLHFLFFISVTLLQTQADPIPANRITCPIKPYTDVDLSKMSGIWYAVRGIEHNSTKQTSRQRNNKACPVISFTLKDESHVDFCYNSKNGSDPQHYNMTVQDMTLPSVWTTEKGSKKHVPFSKLQVNDATGNTLALTMCSSQRLATVILSREKRFDAETVVGITQRLASKGLNTTRTFDRCKS